MPIIKPPVKLSSRGSLDKIDMESAYSSMIAMAAGDYYSAGLLITTTAGRLDYRNFRPDAGITNQHKSADESKFTICTHQVSFAGGPGQSFTRYIPIPSGSIPNFSGTLTGWTSTAKSATNPTNTGSATLWYIRNQGTAVQIGTAQTLTNVGSFTLDINVSGLSVPILPADVIRINYGIETVTTIAYITFTIFLTAEHIG